MKIAVFGHYDSRGGTTAIELPDNATADDVKAAIRRYDVDVFGITEPGDDIHTTVYGMPAREADKMVHNLLGGNESPGVEDFLYVAELYGTDRLEETAHDEVSGFDLEQLGSVLIDWTNVPGHFEREAWYQMVEAINATKPDGRTHYQTYLDNEATRPPDPTVDELIAATMAKPTQLEFVKAQMDYGDDADEKEEEKRIAATATHISNAQYHRWDDDAFGFILMRRSS